MPGIYAEAEWASDPMGGLWVDPLLHQSHVPGTYQSHDTVVIVGKRVAQQIRGIHLLQGLQVPRLLRPVPAVDVEVTRPEEVGVVGTVDLNPGNDCEFHARKFEFIDRCLHLVLDELLGQLCKIFERGDLAELEEPRQLLLQKALLYIVGVQRHAELTGLQFLPHGVQGPAGGAYSRPAGTIALPHLAVRGDGDMGRGQEHEPVHPVRVMGRVGHPSLEAGRAAEDHPCDGSRVEDWAPQLLHILQEAAGKLVTAQPHHRHGVSPMEAILTQQLGGLRYEVHLREGAWEDLSKLLDKLWVRGVVLIPQAFAPHR